MTRIVLAQLAGSAGYGGGERYLELLFDGLDRDKFHPILICPEPGPFVEKMKRKVPTRVVPLTPLGNPLALFRLARLLRRERVAILQTHGARANVYGRLAGWLAGVPCIVSTVHNSIKDYEVSPVLRWCYDRMLRLTAPLARRIICVSEATRRDVLDSGAGTAGQAVTIRNGVERACFDRRGHGARVRAEWRCEAGPVLVVVARLTEQKGHRYLIDALPALLAEWPTLCCLFVGAGESRESLQRRAQQAGVRPLCRFVGATDSVEDFYAAADVVVLPSLSEGFPFVALEALALAKPMIATAVNGVPEIIDHGRTGLLVPPRDAQALTLAIRRLLRNPEEAARMGAAGRAQVAVSFTVEQMVQATVALLETGSSSGPALRPSTGVVA
jgi:glycosyltransferase involved in cell wall biosynthesis